MKLVGSRKLTWGICSIGVLLAIVSVFFLPQIIPVHFANGIADDFGNKVEIFLFPILLLIITLLTGKENIKYFLTHSKTFLTDIQYNLMIDGVLGIILIAEIYVIYASFATVYKGNIIKNLIMDCQSYAKYRPNETTGGIFVSWRRKEELPTGA